MQIKNIKLYNFRNYEKQEIDLEKGINIFFGENAQGKTPIEHARWMKAHLEGLMGVVTELRSIEVGVNQTDSEASYHAVLLATFDNGEAMARYKEHPAHKAISAYCKQVRLSRTVVDYEL